ncbi:Mediator of RNA polymerase II transcription subunit 6 [Knufia obscura]|uniref:Mediator of RNA polymerase II transcription subunit 6 n=1 Tax=Knufia obscura TaxID=1635080 RepID=A0ABR0RM87_9EURO|nr:Mediator of RNA polymerase II transcription subunit 6 [Knufia obscura]
MAKPEVDLSTQFFIDPIWIQANGNWLHANNVLYYFAASPFFDFLSINNNVFQQFQGRPDTAHIIGSRDQFEAELERHKGISYVVEFDPLATPAMVKGPNGMERSETWIIRKQDREKLGDPKEVKVLEYYYIINHVVLQAPRLESMLNYRMMNTLMTLDKMTNAASDLPVFSASNGYSYFRQGQKATATVNAAEGQQSKAGTPMPGSRGSIGHEPETTAEEAEQRSEERILRAALSMTMQYGEQYYDDAPLVGEPGNFRLGTAKDPVRGLKAAELGPPTRSAAASKANTPAPSIKPSPAPASPSGSVRPKG